MFDLDFRKVNEKLVFWAYVHLAFYISLIIALSFFWWLTAIWAYQNPEFLVGVTGVSLLLLYDFPDFWRWLHEELMWRDAAKTVQKSLTPLQQIVWNSKISGLPSECKFQESPDFYADPDSAIAAIKWYGDGLSIPVKWGESDWEAFQNIVERARDEQDENVLYFLLMHAFACTVDEHLRDKAAALVEGTPLAANLIPYLKRSSE